MGLLPLKEFKISRHFKHVGLDYASPDSSKNLGRNYSEKMCLVAHMFNHKSDTLEFVSDFFAGVHERL